MIDPLYWLVPLFRSTIHNARQTRNPTDSVPFVTVLSIIFPYVLPFPLLSYKVRHMNVCFVLNAESVSVTSHSYHTLLSLSPISLFTSCTSQRTFFASSMLLILPQINVYSATARFRDNVTPFGTQLRPLLPVNCYFHLIVSRYTLHRRDRIRCRRNRAARTLVFVNKSSHITWAKLNPCPRTYGIAVDPVPCDPFWLSKNNDNII